MCFSIVDGKKRKKKTQLKRTFQAQKKTQLKRTFQARKKNNKLAKSAPPRYLNIHVPHHKMYY